MCSSRGGWEERDEGRSCRAEAVPSLHHVQQAAREHPTAGGIDRARGASTGTECECGAGASAFGQEDTGEGGERSSTVSSGGGTRGQSCPWLLHGAAASSANAAPCSERCPLSYLELGIRAVEAGRGQTGGLLGADHPVRGMRCRHAVSGTRRKRNLTLYKPTVSAERGTGGGGELLRAARSHRLRHGQAAPSGL